MKTHRLRFRLLVLGWATAVGVLGVSIAFSDTNVVSGASGAKFRFKWTLPPDKPAPGYFISNTPTGGQTARASCTPCGMGTIPYGDLSTMLVTQYCWSEAGSTGSRVVHAARVYQGGGVPVPCIGGPVVFLPDCPPGETCEFERADVLLGPASALAGRLGTSAALADSDTSFAKVSMAVSVARLARDLSIVINAAQECPPPVGVIDDRFVVNAAQECPPPVGSPTATGSGLISYVPLSAGGALAGTGTYRITLTGTLTSAQTAQHIHAGTASPCAANPAISNRPVLFALAAPVGGVMSGSFGPLTAAQETALLTPNGAYINIHTANNPGGEIRGNLQFGSPTATGSGSISYTPLSARGPSAGRGTYSITLTGSLTSAQTAQHIHAGTASPCATNPAISNRPVLFGLNAPVGGVMSGNFGPLTQAQEDALLAPNGAYINIHTANNPGGEIRGNLEFSSNITVHVLSGELRNNVAPLLGSRVARSISYLAFYPTEEAYLLDEGGKGNGAVLFGRVTLLRNNTAGYLATDGVFGGTDWEFSSSERGNRATARPGLTKVINAKFGGPAAKGVLALYADPALGTEVVPGAPPIAVALMSLLLAGAGIWFITARARPRAA